MRKKLILCTLLLTSGISLASQNSSDNQLLADMIVFDGTPEQYRVQTLNLNPKEIVSAVELKSGDTISLPILFANCKTINNVCNLDAKITITGGQLKAPKVLFSGNIWNSSTRDNHLITSSNIVDMKIQKPYVNGEYQITAQLLDKNSKDSLKIVKTVKVVD